MILGALFVGDYSVSEFSCPEMRQGKPWLFHGDLAGVCGILHCLLHGSYMKEFVTENGHCLPKLPGQKAWKSSRTWNGAFWKPLFAKMLNVQGNSMDKSIETLCAVKEALLSKLFEGKSSLTQLKRAFCKQNIVYYENIDVIRKTTSTCNGK